MSADQTSLPTQFWGLTPDAEQVDDRPGRVKQGGGSVHPIAQDAVRFIVCPGFAMWVKAYPFAERTESSPDERSVDEELVLLATGEPVDRPGVA